MKHNEQEMVQAVLDEFACNLVNGESITDEMFEIANDRDSPRQGEMSYRIGCLQMCGLGTSWFETSAVAGYPQGMYAHARLCEVGMGDGCSEDELDPDLLMAAYWYQNASLHGHEKSVGKSEQLFMQVLESAKAGDLQAMLDVAICYETGIIDCAAMDIQLALNWYEKAADSGSVAAHRALWEIYYTGAYGVTQNLHQAVNHIKQWSIGRGEGKSDWRRARSYDISPEKSAYIIDSIRSDFLLAFFESNSTHEEKPDNPLDFLRAIFGSDDEEGINGIVEYEEKDGEYIVNWKWHLIQALIVYRAGGSIECTKKALTDILFEIGLPDIGHEGHQTAEVYLSLDIARFGLFTLGWPFDNFIDRGFKDKNSSRCRRVESTLREIAQKDVRVAKLLLGLILITNADAGSPDFSEGLAWLDETLKENDLLGCLCYADLARAGRISSNSKEIKTALKHVIYAPAEDINALNEKKPRKYEVNNEIFNEDHFHLLKQRASDQLHVIELEEKAHQAKERAQKDMLSYLTHTLNNTLSSGPESARQAMRILGSELYENNREYKAINNIASMFSTFLFAQQLLKTFKLYIAEPETLRLNWDADVEGDATIAVVLAVTLRQTLSQVVFASNHQAALQRLLPHKDAGAVKVIRRAFMDEIVPLDVDVTITGQVFDWVQDHLGLIHVNIDPAVELHFRNNSTRYTFFFSSFSELVYNALKYSDGTQPIEITWGKADEEAGDVFVFRCVNSWTEDSIQSSEGSGKGLVYLARLSEMLGASFEKRLDGHRFIAEIRFPEKLLRGQV
jgi:hypothetical protein